MEADTKICMSCSADAGHEVRHAAGLGMCPVDAGARTLADAAARNAARASRRRTARAAAAEDEERARLAAAETEVHETLGEALTAALARYLVAKPEREMPLKRALALAGYSAELKKLIVRAIELEPALEETILKIAGLAFEDGREEGHDDVSWEDYS